MKTLLTALSGKFPMWEECLSHNLKQCDMAIIRLDGNSFLKSDLPKLDALLQGKPSGYFSSNKEMNKWNWREELITQAHFNWDKITWILFPDEDEKLPDDIELFGNGQIMFDYEMITKGHKAYRYPYSPHAKAFRYHPNLTYHNYQSYARVNLDGRPIKEYKSNQKIKHYCFYKEEWLDAKEKSITERYPEYFKIFPKEYE